MREPFCLLPLPLPSFSPPPLLLPSPPLYIIQCSKRYRVLNHSDQCIVLLNISLKFLLHLECYLLSHKRYIKISKQIKQSKRHISITKKSDMSITDLSRYVSDCTVHCPCVIVSEWMCCMACRRSWLKQVLITIWSELKLIPMYCFFITDHTHSQSYMYM